MKNSYLSLIALFAFANMQAQDVIVKKDGSTIISKVQEINEDNIKYKKFTNLNGPTYTISISDVMTINYENGEKDTFGAAASNNTSNNAEQINASVLKAWKDRPLPTYDGESKDKTTSIFYCVLRPTDDSSIADPNVELSFKGSPRHHNSWDNIIASNITVVVKNKSKNTVYLDLANSFLVRGEYSEPYYIPMANSSTKGTHSGVGVSFGTPGLGVSVGQGTSNYNTSTVYSQRVLAIPPLSSKELEAKTIIPIEGNEYGDKLIMKRIRRHRYEGHRAPHINYDNLPTTVGESKQYQENDIPLNISTLLTYSDKEDISNPRTLNTKFFIRQITGMPKFKGAFFEAMPKYFSSQQLSDIFILLWHDEKEKTE